MSQQAPLSPPQKPGGSVSGANLRQALQRAAQAITRAQRAQQPPPPSSHEPAAPAR